MQLVLRTPTGGLGTDPSAFAVVAASPDTEGRRAWEWEVRIMRAAEGLSRPYDGAGLGAHHLGVRVDHGLVEAEMTTVDLPDSRRLTRPEEELWVAVVESGRVRHGYLEAAAGDVLVWEGDDLLRIDLAPTDGSASLALVSLRRRDGQTLRWVP